MGDKYYSIHLLKGGGRLFILYAYDNQKKSYVSADTWLYTTPIYKKQFEHVIVGETTFKNICKIDENSDAFSSIRYRIWKMH